MPCSRARTVKTIISCSQTISISGENPKLSRSLNIPGNSSRSATAVHAIETDKGWIMLTHGVGPMRKYCIGAILLDLEKPSKVIARLDEPLLAPHEKERDGYVPNVVYSCGAMIHNDKLIIPYAMSDINSGIATVDVKELINCMHAIA